MAWKLFGDNWLTGIICIWHGLLVDIPNGWALCDGTNGTPDLRTRFIRGAAVGINPGGTGGSLTHQHVIDLPTDDEEIDHVHNVEGTTEVVSENGRDAVGQDGTVMEYEYHEHEIDFETDTQSDEHNHPVLGLTAAGGALPLYYDIAFIMKL